MFPWLLLAVQLTLALAALHCFARMVLPAVLGLRGRELILDVWGPVALAIPMLCTASWVNYSVSHTGWTMLSLPAASALAGIALALLAPRRQETALPRLLPIMLLFTSVTLTLLAAAHVMHIWIGQGAFAIVAVVLWINTPDAASSDHDETHNRAWRGMVLVLVASALLGATAAVVSPEFRSLSAAIIAGYVLLTLILAAGIAGPAACARLGGWTGVVGVLGGLGLMAVMVVLPQALRAATGGEVADIQLVAHGFGTFAFEGTVLLAAAGLALMGRRLEAETARLTGMVLLLLAIGMVIYRWAVM